MSIIESAAAMETQDLASARLRYIELITSEDASNAAELRGLMKSLEKSHEQAEDDRAALNEVRKDEAEMVSESELKRLRTQVQATINVTADAIRKHIIGTVNATESAELFRWASVLRYLKFDLSPDIDMAIGMKLQAQADLTIAETGNRERQQRIYAARKSHPDLFGGE